MTSSSTGAFGASTPGAAASPWDAFARQAFGQWSDWARSAAPMPAAAAMPDWSDALGWWSRMAQGGHAAPQMGSALGRFDAQAREWMAQMQRVAAQFAGREASPADVAQAWRQAAGRAFDPLGAAFGGMDPQAWTRALAPWMQQAGGAARDALSLPTFGFAREQQERWQGLLRAQLDVQADSADYTALMGQAWQDGFARFESRLAVRAHEQQPVESARALFDLWIDAAEEAYAQVALSPAFREAYGKHVNALMRLKAAVDGEAERSAAALNMPTRTEVDSAHRKIVQLEREVRRLRDALAALSPRLEAADVPARAQSTQPTGATSGPSTTRRAKTRGKASAPDTGPAPGTPPPSLATRARKADR